MPESPDSVTAWHYGDPLGEQRAARNGVIVVDRSDRAVIELAGPERLTWLHTISSQHVSALPDRTSAENLSLDGQGRVEDHFIVSDVDEVTWLDTEAFRGGALADFLTKMVFWSQVTVTPRLDMAVLTLVGPDAFSDNVATMLELDPNAAPYTVGNLPDTPWPARYPPGTEARDAQEPLGFWRIMPPFLDGPLSDTTLPVVDLVIPRSQLNLWWTALTEARARAAGSWAFDALRVAALRPRLGSDTDEKTIPQEANWIGGPDEFGAVHLEKGCYRGQETVARVHNLGKSPRQLVLLHLDGSTDERPGTGEPVTAGGRTVGRLGTVIDHWEYGPIALALVKRNVGVDVDLVAGDESAVGARIDPDSVRVDDRVQAGKAAISRLRTGSA